MPSTLSDGHDENANNEETTSSMNWLSPIGQGVMDFGTFLNNLDTPSIDNNTNMMDSSFPDVRDDIKIHSPGQQGDANVEEEKHNAGEDGETEEEQIMRKIEEWEALAWQLMGDIFT